MVIKKTILNDEEFLRQVSKEVDFNDKSYLDDIKKLIEFCNRKDNTLLALAAVQIGIPKRIIYIHTTELEKEYKNAKVEGLIMINPVILSETGLTRYWEACGSCLDKTGLVERPYEIEIEYYDIDGKKHEETIKGEKATVFSHEFDHLNGVLHIDKALEIRDMNKEERKEFRKMHPYEIIRKTGDFVDKNSKKNRK